MPGRHAVVQIFLAPIALRRAGCTAASPMWNEPGIDSAGRTSPRESKHQFVDSAGNRWRVFERERRTLDGSWETMLVFESPASVRCVRMYPDDWRRLSPEVLEHISWRK